MKLSQVYPPAMDILEMDRHALSGVWRTAFGKTPSKHISAAFLRRVLAHHAKMHVVGGLRAEVARALDEVAKGATAAPPKTTLKPGAQLMREWNGRSYQVEVAEIGFVLDGRRFESLTAVARHITGTNWSGPRFFGLTKRKSSAKRNMKSEPPKSIDPAL